MARTPGLSKMKISVKILKKKKKKLVLFHPLSPCPGPKPPEKQEKNKIF